MVISQKLLNPGEHILLSTRTHVKALFVPALVLIVVAAAGGYLASLPSGAHAGAWRLAIGVIALLLVLWYVVRPFLRWLATSYTFTDRRLITRTGLLTRTGHDIPLNRISDIEYQKGLLDRLFGCGTLVISDASNDGEVLLNDIPHVEQAQLTVSNELYRHTQGSTSRPSVDPADDGT